MKFEIADKNKKIVTDFKYQYGAYKFKLYLYEHRWWGWELVGESEHCKPVKIDDFVEISEIELEPLLTLLFTPNSAKIKFLESIKQYLKHGY